MKLMEQRQTELTDSEIKQIYDRLKNPGSSDIPKVINADAAESENGQEVPVDEYNYPFEPEGIYNSGMLDFEEIAGALWTLIFQTHYCATRYHRLSPNYILLMQHLEKDIRQMGSYCITKAVLEQSGREFPGLKAAELKELCCMVSLHFRKCCRAYKEIQEKTNSQDLNMMSWIFRWAALFERLKATQEKIERIKSGEIKTESLLQAQNVYKDEPRMRRDRSAQAVDPQLKASSMPIIRSYAQEVKQQKKAEEKRERMLKRKAEQAKRNPGSRNFRSNALPKIPGIGLSEMALRRLLMDEAEIRAGKAEAGIIAREPVSKLIERFEKLTRYDPGAGNREPGTGNQVNEVLTRSGPSNETRKRLREKRKKRK